MILNLADAAYFGHFNLEILRSMRQLEILELRVENVSMSSWRGEDSVADLAREMKEEEELHTEWEMPLIRLVKKKTGEIVVLGRKSLVFWWASVDGDTPGFG